MQMRPILIADAGFMYAAKMSGQSGCYDFFTPDVGELVFLANELAAHPFYTGGFIIHQNDDVSDLIRRAYQHQNAARYLLVKGDPDYIARENQVVETVDHLSIDAMEAIGGTNTKSNSIIRVLRKMLKEGSGDTNRADLLVTEQVQTPAD
jgi:hypothetical protein